MSTSGPAFYDDDAVFATYIARRQRSDSPNNTLEQPVILELAGDLAGRRVLDLGCGDAAFGRMVLAHGGSAYVGVEGSRNMAAVARETLAGTNGRVQHCTIEEWEAPKAAFDLAVARLSLHYLADLAPTFARVYQALAVGGRFVFSVEHPVITSCDRGWPAGTLRQDWVVDDYFVTGARETMWMGGAVRKYHRTVEDYFHALQQAGFVVERLRESRPQRKQFADEQAYARRQRIPLFLFLVGCRM
ncbi:MAG: methyltransferase [Roseiflexaceae bacterium]